MLTIETNPANSRLASPNLRLPAAKPPQYRKTLHGFQWQHHEPALNKRICLMPGAN